jgi:phosphatidate cytidylyltransferase
MTFRGAKRDIKWIDTMLQTRLWMGTILVLITAGMLVFDQRLAPWYPFLLVFVLGLSLAAVAELIRLLGGAQKVQAPLLAIGVAVLVTTNWWRHPLSAFGLAANPTSLLLGAFVALTLIAFLWEMATFRTVLDTPIQANGSVERMSRTIWALGYLGLLPGLFAGLRWLYPANQPEYGSVALALVIFVPKCCDIGAYCTGRLVGRHPLTPVLSPKKTWEGAAGGLTLGTLTAIGIDQWGPVPLLGKSLGREIGFGITLGIAGILGDLAESLVKRACRQKDASAAVPGFGGVLDVVDAVIFAAPVGYLWLASLG